MHFKIICFVQIYNELEKGNLERFVKHIKPHVDEIVAYDDGSTDGSYEYMQKHTNHIIRGCKNSFKKELFNKQRLLEYALTLEPDFILWMDCDEVLSEGANLQKVCNWAKNKRLDGVEMREINLWRSKTWHRTDSLYDLGWYVRLWTVRPGIRFECQDGLHLPQFPSTIRRERVHRMNGISVIHYGFSDFKQLAYKWWCYSSHNQKDYMLYRLLLETHHEQLHRDIIGKDPKYIELKTAMPKLTYELRLVKIKKKLMPPDLWVEDESMPTKLPFETMIEEVTKYKDKVLRPKISFVCLIYRSVKWLQFLKDQLEKYTDLTNSEFYFVANDATQHVKDYLKDNEIKHYIWDNTEEQRKEWYINNVYRAWNHSGFMAKGDYIVFLNSDMCFSEGWFEKLFARLNYDNCVCSRLVESGRYESGLYGISQNFGHTCSEYKEEEFNQYVKEISEDKTMNSGLYMPMLIRKSDFVKVGGFPEGNLVPGSDIYNPIYAKQGEPAYSGDKAFVDKLNDIGIKHQTAFDSIVYHFQEGEQSDE